MEKIYRIIILLTFLLTILVGSYAAPRIVCEPHRNLDALISKSENETESIFESSAGFLQYHPRGYVLVLYMGEHYEYAPVEYLTVYRLNNHSYVEIISGAGPENARSVSKAYLKEINIDVTPLDVNWRKRYE